MVCGVPFCCHFTAPSFYKAIPCVEEASHSHCILLDLEDWLLDLSCICCGRLENVELLDGKGLLGGVESKSSLHGAPFQEA